MTHPPNGEPDEAGPYKTGPNETEPNETQPDETETNEVRPDKAGARYEIEVDDELSEAALKSNEGAALFLRFQENEADLDLLVRVVRVFAEAAACCAEDDPARALVFSNFAYALLKLYERTQDASLLQMALGCGRPAVAAGAEDAPERGHVLLRHLLALEAGVERSAGTELLEEALGVARLTARMDPEKSVPRTDRLKKLLRTAVRRGDLRRFPELVAVLRWLLGTAPPGHGDRPARLAELAEVLREQYDLAGDVQALAESVAVRRELVELIDGGDGMRTAYYLSLLGISIRDLQERTGSEDLLAEAIAVWRRGLGLPLPGPLRAIFLRELSMLLLKRGEAEKDPALLREAVTAAADAVAEQEDVDTLGCLGDALKAVGDPQAIARYRQAVRLSGRSPARGRWESQLSEALVAFGGDLAEAVELARSAARRYAGQPGEEVAWHRLSEVLKSLASARGDAGLMAESTAAARKALDVAPGAAYLMHHLGQQLYLHFKMTVDFPLLEEAVSWARRALAAPQDGRSYVYSAGLGRSLHLLARHRKDEDLLSEAVERLTTAIEGVSADHPLRRSFQQELASALTAKADGTQAPEPRVRRALECARAAAVDGDASALAVVAGVLRQLFLITGDDGHADEGIRLYRRVLRVHEAESSGRQNDAAQRGAFLLGLGDLLHDRFEARRDLADLDEAIDAYGEALRIVPEGHFSRSHLASMYFVLLAFRSQETDDAEDEERMFEAGLAAVEIVTDPEQAASLRQVMALGLEVRNLRTGDLADLDTAIGLCRDFAGSSEPAALRALVQAQLCSVLRVRFGRTGALADLDASVAAGEAAVEASDGDPESLRRACSLLSAALRERFGVTQEQADIDRAIEFGRLAAEGGDSAGTSHYSTAVLERYEQAGHPDDLHLSIRLAREALTSAGEHGDRAAALSNLGTMLARRHEALGTGEDLEQAIVSFREAAAITGEHHTARPGRFLNAALALRRRYRETGEDTDFQEAIDAVRLASAVAPEGHPVRSRAFSTLSTVLDARYDIHGELADLEAAIASARESREAARGVPALSHLSANLAVYLFKRFEATGDRADLEEAIALCRECLEQPGHATANLRIQLGRALAARYAVGREEADAEEAVAVWRRGATDPTGRIDARLESAVSWARFTADTASPAAAADAYREAVSLQRLMVSLGATRGDHERLLTRYPGLASDAAAAVLAAGDPVTAVELLEQGRSVLWAQLLDLRTDLKEIEERDPGLARRLVAVRARLDGATDAVTAP